MTIEASLHSPLWFRVADLRPRLRAHVQMRRQHSRGERWMLLVDPASGRAHRLGAAAWRLVGLCNGQRTLDEIWRGQRDAPGNALPTQDELLQLVVQLHEAGLLHCAMNADARALFAVEDRRRRKERLAASNPLAFRVRLGDPTPLLRALEPLGRALFSPLGLALWALLLAVGALLALVHAPRIAAQAAQWAPQMASLGALWVLYPAIKALHELAHGLAVRRLGGEVQDWGVSLLLLLPMPWVDASAANAMPLARHRMLVSAAGVLAELGLATLALFVWLVVEPGRVADIAFAVMVLGGLSTLLANANPLLRLDGYFLMTDALQLPNLALRSSLWWRQTLLRLLGARGPGSEPPVMARGERGWLIAYQPLAWLWRVVLAVLAGSWLGSLHAALGWAAWAVSAWGLVVLPLWRAARLLAGGRLPATRSGPVRRRALAVAVLAVLAVTAVPVPFVTTAQGVVWLPENAWLRLPVAGAVERFAVADGAAVTAGMPLVVLDNHELDTRHAQVAEQLAAVRAEFYRALPQTGAGDAGSPAARLASLEAELAYLDEQRAGLRLTAGVAGTLSVPRQADLIGRWFARGATLGHVLPPGNTTVRLAVPQADADLLRQARFELRLADAPGRVMDARLAQAAPSIGTALPSAALGRRSGGDIDLDPADAEGRTAREPLAWIDLQSAAPLGARVGTRVTVRMSWEWQPLAWQAQRRLRQLVLQRFEPRGA